MNPQDFKAKPDKNDMTKVYNRLRKIRKMEHATQEQFAGTLNMHRRAYSRLESGQVDIRIDLLLQVLERYPWVSSSWLTVNKGTILKRYQIDD